MYSKKLRKREREREIVWELVVYASNILILFDKGFLKHENKLFSHGAFTTDYQIMQLRSNFTQKTILWKQGLIEKRV